MKSTLSDSPPDPWRTDSEPMEKELEQFRDDASLCFEDSFVAGHSVSPKELNERLPDSAEYLASLESKLERLKSKRKGKDIIKSLEERTKTSMLNFLSADNQMTLADEDFMLDTPVSSSHPIVRYVAPDKQALTVGELVELVKADHLAQVLEHEMDEERKIHESPN